MARHRHGRAEACNLEYAWSRPDDPARAPVQQPGHRAYIEAAELRAAGEREADPRDVIEAYLVHRVERGLPPAVVRLLADTQLLADLGHAQPPAELYLGLTELRDDLFCAVALPWHRAS